MSVTLLEKLVEPVARCLTEDSARTLLDLRADPEVQARIEELAERSNQGLLSEEERTEYDRYLAAYHLVTVLQAEARRILNKPAA